MTSERSTVLNTLFTLFLIVVCGTLLYRGYRWALQPLLNKYNISIQLHDISSYLQRLNSAEVQDGAIRLDGSDVLESGIGVSNLNTVTENVIETRPNNIWKSRGLGRLIDANNDDRSSLYFDTEPDSSGS
ncbi:hypothetical protein V1511DRAFT_509639 [Dipodascopsis uninucleata]